jgi:hypothetical protein
MIGVVKHPMEFSGKKLNDAGNRIADGFNRFVVRAGELVTLAASEGRTL